MRDATYTDEIGRMFRVRMPEGVSDADIDLGLFIGPPKLDALDLPQGVMVRLHNQLFARGLLTEADVRIRLDEVVAALQAALAIDAQTIHTLYVNAGTDQVPERSAPVELTPPEDVYGAWRKGPSQPSKQVERNPGAGAVQEGPVQQSASPARRR